MVVVDEMVMVDLIFGINLFIIHNAGTLSFFQVNHIILQFIGPDNG